MKKLMYYILAALVISTVNSVVLASEINIYSHRQPFLINPFLKE